jgi:hypothetical protein
LCATLAYGMKPLLLQFKPFEQKHLNDYDGYNETNDPKNKLSIRF